jgi:hypothetical protein
VVSSAWRMASNPLAQTSPERTPMASLAVDYRYVYPRASTIETGRTLPNLALATCTDEETNPYFFEGKLVHPFLTARLLQDLSALVRTRFFLQIDPLVLDPVVTSHGDFIRFEVFSGCCSVYARLDLPPPALAGETKGRGTTNVDFNPPMLAALGRISRTDDLKLALGADELMLARNQESIVEKRVRLPIRWLKSFTAVTSYSKALEPVHQVDAITANRFLKSLPRSVDNRARWWVVRSGRSLRISQREAPGAVAAAALNRLRIFENNVTQARSLTIFGHPSIDASGWQLDFGDLRFSMIMTHDVWRGFSGEGQGLFDLTVRPAASLLKPITSALHWQSVLELSGINQHNPTQLSEQQLQQGLEYLSTLGQVGFDMQTGQYFHRQLPYDSEFVSRLQPRLKNARKLLASGSVQPLAETSSSDHNRYAVRSSDVTHTVQLTEDSFRCTCPWFGKHGVRRGPCKHVLAAYLKLHGETEVS